MAGPIRFCSVEGCTSRCHGQGLCVRHYKRMRRNGSVDVVKRVYRGPDVCEVEGCGVDGAIKRGMCTTHYQRWSKHGDVETVLVREYATGADHQCWVGDAAAYRTVHSRLDRERGSAKTHDCAVCSTPADQWSYDHNDPAELVGVVNGGVEVPYSVNPDHYVALCHPCHRRVDLRWLPVMVA